MYCLWHTNEFSFSPQLSLPYLIQFHRIVKKQESFASKTGEVSVGKNSSKRQLIELTKMMMNDFPSRIAHNQIPLFRMEKKGKLR